MHTIFPQNALMTRTTGALKFVSSATAKGLATAAVVLTVRYDIYKQINRWLNDEISGKRCAKNIIDSVGGFGGGWGGGVGRQSELKFTLE